MLIVHKSRKTPVAVFVAAALAVAGEVIAGGRFPGPGGGGGVPPPPPPPPPQAPSRSRVTAAPSRTEMQDPNPFVMAARFHWRVSKSLNARNGVSMHLHDARL